MALPIVCPSHKRADRVLTKKAVAGLILCVPESQVPEYREHNPEVEIVGHPDSVVGLPPKRNWILDHFGDSFQIDDDIRQISRLWIEPRNRHDPPVRVDPETARDVIFNLYEIARGLGAKLFGLNHYPSPEMYHGHAPFRLTGYICGGAIGVVRTPELRFPDDPYNLVEDYYICLLNAYYYRYIVVDNRFGLVPVKTFKNRGGLAEIRNLAREEESFHFLKRKFGPAIQKRRAGGRFRASHEWQRTIQLPF